MKKNIASVIMSICNDQETVGDSIESILSQTFGDFEFIIVVDGATDNSENIVRGFSDKRIKIIKNKNNCGLPYSLNVAINQAKGDLLFRMDADDISYPNRFQRQVEFMNSNRNIGVCGAAIRRFDELGRSNVINYPQEHENIVQIMNFENCIAHPVVCLRRDVLISNKILYDQSIIFSQDWDLWNRISKYTKFSNLEDVLLDYRTKSNPNLEKIDLQNQFAEKNIIHGLKNLGIELSDDSIMLHKYIFSKRYNYLNVAHDVADHLIFLINETNDRYIAEFITKTWIAYCNYCANTFGINNFNIKHEINERVSKLNYIEGAFRVFRNKIQNFGGGVND